MAEKLFLIDAMAMIYRSYFAMISNPLINSKGKNTSAVYGFLNSLSKILSDEKPDHIAVCFDTEKPTFRHKEFPAYKAQRAEIPSDMPWQIVKVKEIVRALNIPSIELDGFEADDIIGTLAKKAEIERVNTYMVTPDKDYMQLVTDLTFQYKPTRNIYGTRMMESEIIDSKGVFEKFGVEPLKVIDVLGLMGDTADNIPGVRGVGEKTAIALIQEFGSIENIYANIDKVNKPKLRENLITYKADAMLAKRLVTIDTQVPLKINFHELNRRNPDAELTAKLFNELEFKSLLKKFISEEISISPKPNTGKQINEDLESDLKITITGDKVSGIEVNIPTAQKIIKSIEDTHHKYYTVKTNEEYIRLIKKLKETEFFSFDTETDSLDPMTAKLVGMSFSFNEHEGIYVPIIEAGEETSDSLFGEETAEEKIGIDVKFAIDNLKPLL